MTNMRYSISNTAEYGDLTRRKTRHRPGSARKRCKRSSRIYKSENSPKSGSTNTRLRIAALHRTRKEQANHPLEKVGAGLRSDMMPWLGQNRLVDKSKN